ncbi:hypothetical protein C2I06_21220 [Niallia circulans]|uniref:hypothetical protein n=1 Tax=Niallia circulans TaxID=1397 RepID=UPI0002EC1DCB|nr:hypothetical protein [Niallia circulans]AYV69162.1 hypothetical protein C2I06_21220 [Niallia circulans]
MKKFISLIALLLVLTACGSGNVGDNLQSKKWNVVSSNGESYTAEFSKDTVSFQKGAFTLGMTYEIDDNTITLERKEDTYTFEFEKVGDEYKSTAVDDETNNTSGYKPQ